MNAKILKYGAIAAAVVGVVVLKTNTLGFLKNVPKAIAKSCEERARIRIEPEKINFC